MPTSSGVRAAVTPLSVSCTYYRETVSYPLAYTQVGEFHRDYDLTIAKFTYGQTADSTIDIGFSTNNEATWSISGSLHVANSLSTWVAANATTNNYHWALRTQFKYGTSRLFKDCTDGTRHAWQGSEEIDPMSWNGGGMTASNTLTQPTRQTAYSQNYTPGTEFHRSSSQLTKWTLATYISGAYLGAQSGSSTSVRIDYVFGTAKPLYYLYGDNDVPAFSARVFQITP